MSSFARSHPAYRAAATAVAAVGHRRRRRSRRLCWVTHRGRSVTRLTGAARGPTREWFVRGEAWGVTRATW